MPVLTCGVPCVAGTPNGLACSPAGATGLRAAVLRGRRCPRPRPTRTRANGTTGLSPRRCPRPRPTRTRANGTTGLSPVTAWCTGRACAPPTSPAARATGRAIRCQRTDGASTMIAMLAWAPTRTASRARCSSTSPWSCPCTTGTSSTTTTPWGRSMNARATHSLSTARSTAAATGPVRSGRSPTP